MTTEAPLCRIERALGIEAVCPRECCPFWEAGSVGIGSCAFEHIDISNNRDLAAWLLHIRAMIDATDQ